MSTAVIDEVERIESRKPFARASGIGQPDSWKFDGTSLDAVVEADKDHGIYQILGDDVPGFQRQAAAVGRH